MLNNNNKVLEKKAIQDKQQKLYNAIKENNLTKVAELLKEEKVGPNFKFEGCSMLFWAVTTNSDNTSDEIVFQLLENRANPNYIGSGRDTPLHFAADRHYIVKMNHLLKFGADINVVGSDDSTPLHKAVMSSIDKNRLEAVKLLLEMDADIGILNYEDQTAKEIAQKKDIRK
ncbi:MAG TPA: ankyrin repeat domain-containing protein [Rickettsia endosymbiont of Pyrocoelia pectoralis]|nr:ankyrin repeat domain-containing protein [Rickettsia endosymbiont of Pyrocoelia pectoralis]